MTWREFPFGPWVDFNLACDENSVGWWSFLLSIWFFSSWRKPYFHFGTGRISIWHCMNYTLTQSSFWFGLHLLNTISSRGYNFSFNYCPASTTNPPPVAEPKADLTCRSKEVAIIKDRAKKYFCTLYRQATVEKMRYFYWCIIHMYSEKETCFYHCVNRFEQWRVPNNLLASKTFFYRCINIPFSLTLFLLQ